MTIYIRPREKKGESKLTFKVCVPKCVFRIRKLLGKRLDTKLSRYIRTEYHGSLHSVVYATDLKILLFFRRPSRAEASNLSMSGLSILSYQDRRSWELLARKA